MNRVTVSLLLLLLIVGALNLLQAIYTSSREIRVTSAVFSAASLLLLPVVLFLKDKWIRWIRPTNRRLFYSFVLMGVALSLTFLRELFSVLLKAERLSDSSRIFRLTVSLLWWHWLAIVEVKPPAVDKPAIVREELYSSLELRVAGARRDREGAR